jgi:hypothetical protein
MERTIEFDQILAKVNELVGRKFYHKENKVLTIKNKDYEYYNSKH